MADLVIDRAMLARLLRGETVTVAYAEDQYGVDSFIEIEASERLCGLSDLLAPILSERPAAPREGAAGD